MPAVRLSFFKAALFITDFIIIIIYTLGIKDPEGFGKN